MAQFALWLPAQDTAPLAGIRYVGLSTWDNHMAYRNIRLLPPLDLEAGEQEGEEEGREAGSSSGRVPPLSQLCAGAIAAELGCATAAAVLAFAEGLVMPAGGACDLLTAAAGAVAANLADILAEQPDALQGLSMESIQSVASDSGMVRAHRSLLLLPCSELACAGAAAGAQACRPSGLLWWLDTADVVLGGGAGCSHTTIRTPLPASHEVECMFLCTGCGPDLSSWGKGGHGDAGPIAAPLVCSSAPSL